MMGFVSSLKRPPESGLFVNTLAVLGRRSRREAVASAQGSHFEVEWSVFGVAAFIDQTVRGLMRRKDGH